MRCGGRNEGILRQVTDMDELLDTIEAAKEAENHKWLLGEALVLEADETKSGSRGLNAVAKELADHGIEWSTKYLSELRRTAEAFPRDRRHNLPWKVHAKAGNPDMLDVIVRAARKEGEKVTTRYVAAVLRGIRLEAKWERKYRAASD
jgi:hypothetical protein